jgi:hypothetical protein
MKDFYNYGIRVVNENPIPTGIILAAVALALYFGFKNGDTKKTFGVKTEQALIKAGGI